MRISIYDQQTHIQALSLDLQFAKLIVIIVSPFLQMDNLIRWQPDIEKLIARGIRGCVRVDLPDEYYIRSEKKWLEAKNQKLRDCVAFLERLGCHVTVVANVHTKLVIIDYHILWEGSLNFLSSNPDKKPIDERVPRVDDVIHAMSAYSRHNCDRCEKCCAVQDARLPGLIELTENSLVPSKPPLRSSNPKEAQGKPDAPTRFARVFSKFIAQQTRSMRVTRTRFAEAVGISRMALDSIENGRSAPSLKTLTRSVELVGWRLILVPNALLPLINMIVKSYHRAEVSKMLPIPTLPTTDSRKSKTSDSAHQFDASPSEPRSPSAQPDTAPPPSFGPTTRNESPTTNNQSFPDASSDKPDTSIP